MARGEILGVQALFSVSNRQVVRDPGNGGRTVGVNFFLRFLSLPEVLPVRRLVQFKHNVCLVVVGLNLITKEGECNTNTTRVLCIFHVCSCKFKVDQLERVITLPYLLLTISREPSTVIQIDWKFGRACTCLDSCWLDDPSGCAR